MIEPLALVRDFAAGDVDGLAVIASAGSTFVCWLFAMALTGRYE